jgi:hypothetical protein
MNNNGLWAIEMSRTSASLWIVARSMESAIKKAKKFIAKTPKLQGCVITGIRGHGTIDVF